MSEKTKRLYFENAYQTEFEAQVVEKLHREDQLVLILNQTCFYPESGGQPSDKGLINEVDVLQVREEEDKILHFLKSDVIEDRIQGKIDWVTRFDHMQQHSGQHILSQSFSELIGAETLSFHLGEKASSLEMNLRKISDETVREVERRANEIVFQDREIKSQFIREEEVHTVPLRRPPKKSGVIRVIEVADYDHSACGGTHVRRTGEIGLIKILKWEKIRENIRFEFLCGRRALEDYIQKNRILREVSNKLTAHERDIQSSVEKLFSDLKFQKKRNQSLKKIISGYEAQEIIRKSGQRIITEVFTEKTSEELKILALNIIKRGDYIVFFGLEEKGRVHLVFACSESFDIDLRQVIPLVSPLIKGKGGGSPSLIQLAGEDVKNLHLALEKANHWGQAIIGVRPS
jgi:alanyl-tRNA synthetase